MSIRHPRHVPVVRNRVIRVAAIADLVARLDELEAGIEEQARLGAELGRFLDGVERDVMSLAASRLERRAGSEVDG